MHANERARIVLVETSEFAQEFRCGTCRRHITHARYMLWLCVACTPFSSLIIGCVVSHSLGHGYGREKQVDEEEAEAKKKTTAATASKRRRPLIWMHQTYATSHLYLNVLHGALRSHQSVSYSSEPASQPAGQRKLRACMCNSFFIRHRLCVASLRPDRCHVVLNSFFCAVRCHCYHLSI